MGEPGPSGKIPGTKGKENTRELRGASDRQGPQPDLLVSPWTRTLVFALRWFFEQTGLDAASAHHRGFGGLGLCRGQLFFRARRDGAVLARKMAGPAIGGA